MWRFLRWLLALAIVAAATGASVRGGWVTCNDQIAQIGKKATAETCHPPTVDDVSVIGVLLVLFLLLWPDITEFGLPGGISLKRRLAKNESAVAAQSERTNLLAERLTFIQSQQQVASATAQAQTILVLGDPKESLAQLGAKVRVFEGEARVDGMKPSDGPTEAPAKPTASEELDRGEHESRLIRLWRDLGARVRRAEEVEASLDKGVSPSEWVSELLRTSGRTGAEQLVLWRELFREEIEVVQAARGAVLADRPISTGDLAAAVAIAEELLELPVPGG